MDDRPWPPPNPTTDAQFDRSLDASVPCFEPDSSHRRTVSLFLAAVAAASIVGIGIGVTMGMIVGTGSADSCPPSDGWCDLGAAVLGLLAGLVVGTIGYVVTAVTFVRHRRPPGDRAGVVSAVLLFPPVALLALSLLQQLVTVVR